jgi:hypothetical protein
MIAELALIRNASFAIFLNRLVQSLHTLTSSFAMWSLDPIAVELDFMEVRPMRADMKKTTRWPQDSTLARGRIAPP